MRRGDVVDYTISEQTAVGLNNTVSKGDVYPLLVVSVNTDDDDVETGVTGTVFLPGGNFLGVSNVPLNVDPEPAPEPVAPPQDPGGFAPRDPAAPTRQEVS